MKKKTFLQKSKIYLILFLVGSIFLIILTNIKISNSQGQTDCDPNLAEYFGSLESPIFDLSEPKTITKFLWKGYFESGSYVNFTIYYGSTTNFSELTINSRPSEIGNLGLQNVRYIKYKINLYKCEEDAIPRVDKIFIYYSK